MKRLPLILLILLALLSGVQAQSSFTTFTWDFAGVSLLVPVEWEAPQSLQVSGQETLQIAASFTSDPLNRPPEVPYVTLALLPAAESPDVLAFASNELRAAGIIPSGPIPATLFDSPTGRAAGFSEDGAYFGIGTGGVLPDGRVLLVIGRAPASQQDSLSTIYDAITTSLRTDMGNIQEQLTYGVLWQTTSTPADGLSAFLESGGIALASGNTLYLADAAAGLVEFDARTGSIRHVTPFDNFTEPDSIAVAPDGTVYVADLLCTCVMALREGAWDIVLDGFDVNGPRNIAITPDGTIYATDEDANGFILRVLTDDTVQRQALNLSLTGQPLLAVNRSGQLTLLTDEGMLYTLDSGVWMETLTLFPLPETQAYTFNTANNAVLATTEGAIIYDADGNEYQRIGQLAQDIPTYGEYFSLNGIAAGDDGTIYWSDSDGSFGSVMALNTRVQAGRVGQTRLLSGLAVIGQLDETTTEQVWTFDGSSGEQITLTVIASDDAGRLDPMITVFGPNGAEITSNDNHENPLLLNITDSQIENLTLQRDGIYTALVSRVSGSGIYSLGFSKAQPILLDGASSIELAGRISPEFPTQRWILSARGGETYTLTVLSDLDSTLDPILRIYTPNGDRGAENDDAENTSLSTDSQIADYRIPFNGMYIVEVSGVFGEGGYTLQVERLP